MLCFNGAQSTSEVIYRNSITIPTGGKFVFSVWVANLHIDKQNPFQMEFYIDGVATGNTFNGNADNDWDQFYHTLDLTAGNHVIEIYNKNNNTTRNNFV